MSTKQALADLQYKTVLLQNTFEHQDKYYKTMFNVLSIAKGRDYITIADGGFFERLSSVDVKKEDCFLAGVAYPLAWEVWVKK